MRDGQLSQAVARIAQLLDFEVLLCDPREEYASTLDVPGAIRVAGMPDDAVRDLRPDAHTAVVALTHDPKLDDMALLEALRSGAFYVGALGSSRNQAARKQRLAEHFDMTAAELDRLHGPVGLRIGAKTPAEIAVSILAEVIAVRNGVALVQKKEGSAQPNALRTPPGLMNAKNPGRHFSRIRSAGSWSAPNKTASICWCVSFTRG